MRPGVRCGGSFVGAVVQRFMTVDKSDISPTRLTALSTLLILASHGALHAPISSSEDSDGLQVFVFLLVVCLLLSLTLLGCLDWLPLRPSSSKGRAKRSTLHRLLKPRSPDDCPACRLASTSSSGADPSPLPVRPWREVKSRGEPPNASTPRGSLVLTTNARTSHDLRNEVGRSERTACSLAR